MLDILPQRYGFLRLQGLEADPGDVYISASQIRRCELRSGDEVAGPAREPRRGERHRALVHVDQVNGAEPPPPERPDFDELPADRPRAPAAAGRRRLQTCSPARSTCWRRWPSASACWSAPRRARAGRRCCAGSPARSPPTEGVELIVLLVDERPEEATAWREAVPGAQFAIATAEMAPGDQLRLAELALARARRRAETGGDAVLLVDSLSRLDYAAGDVAPSSACSAPGATSPGGGSLTVIVATTLVDANDEGAPSARSRPPRAP